MKEGKYLVLTINFGSTSSKLAVYKDNEEMVRVAIEHDRAELACYVLKRDEIPFRTEVVRKFLVDTGYEIGDFDAIGVRSGNVRNMGSGTYLVDQALVDALLYDSPVDHICDACAPVGYTLGKESEIPVYMSDSPSYDERLPELKYTGLPEVMRYHAAHTDNMYEVLFRTSNDINVKYADMTYIIAHLGGGISFALHHKGRVIDAYCDDIGAFSPERAGMIPSVELAELCYSGKYTKSEMLRMLRGAGGLYAHLGTADCREVERRIVDGDKHAAVIYKAFAANIAKTIGEFATVVGGKVDYIVITGGAARSKYLCSQLEERCGFIAPLKFYPGEFEMEHIARCALEALENEREVKKYSK